MKKELIEKLLEVSRQAAREVESAVSAVKDPHLRGVIAGVIMQRILDEVDINERVASAAASLPPIRETRSGKQHPVANLGFASRQFFSRAAPFGGGLGRASDQRISPQQVRCADELASVGAKKVAPAHRPW